ncbi:GlxA family transcriptional regulator [Aestuariispira ectoiniformans]|uniref:GlxA family transcriptional regulator n=1 Tax=Aestuariispira ectoiniformans TaxID=2775080 RepID=UPI00223AFFBC|nr:helix-turn-helix domain-containing protein [Aestuariispira ectoiniformans]
METDREARQVGGEAYVNWLDDIWDRRLPNAGGQGSRLTVGILLWPTFPLMSFTGIVESLRHAGDYGDHSEQRYARWEILGAEEQVIRSSCGIELRTTHPYVNPSEFDYLFVIGGLLKDLEKAPDRHRAYIHATHKVGCVIVGLCTGSFVLAEEKLLEGQLACIHPYHTADFELAFPGHRFTSKSDFEGRDGIVTVPGGISILSYMTKIIGEHFGPERSAKSVHQLSLTERGSLGTLERVGMNRYLDISDPRIQKALVILESRSTDNPRISELAASLGLTERHFLRLFKAQVGMSPQNFLIEAKLKAAVWMLRNTSKSITSVAYAAGFSSAASLAGHCAKRLEATPSMIRRGVIDSVPYQSG